MYHDYNYVDKVTSEMHKKYFFVNRHSIKHKEINFNYLRTLYNFSPEIFNQKAFGEYKILGNTLNYHR